MTCPRCDSRMIRTQTYEGYEWWCVAHGGYQERRDPQPEDMLHRHGAAALNRMFVEREDER